MRRAVATFLVLAGLATAQAAARAPTTIAVTAGKPVELSFRLSKSSLIPVGAVIFKVTNEGRAGHSFKLCSSPKGGTTNSCTGKSTGILQPGRSLSLKVTLTKGVYEYLSTVPGEAGAGMKGLIGVGMKAPVVTAATAPAVSNAAGAAPTATVCAHPQSTTVNVNEFDFGFTLSSSSIPCGTLTFVQTNTGKTTHNFAIANKSGAMIESGQSTSFDIVLSPGIYAYVCEVPQHAAMGMTGRLTVTG
jgi:nitrite reductase (NO-forming)